MLLDNPYNKSKFQKTIQYFGIGDFNILDKTTKEFKIVNPIKVSPISDILVDIQFNSDTFFVFKESPTSDNGSYTPSDAVTNIESFNQLYNIYLRIWKVRKILFLYF